MRRALLFAALPLLTLSIACGDKDDDDDEGGDDTASDDSGGGGSGGSTDGVSPWIMEADAWCYLHETGDTAYYWVAEAVADDPQGVATLEAFTMDAVKVYSGDAEVSSQALVCSENGVCSASFNGDNEGVSCSSADSYTFAIVVTDEDGNTSEVSEVTGREGSSASGMRVHEDHTLLVHDLLEAQAAEKLQ